MLEPFFMLIAVAVGDAGQMLPITALLMYNLMGPLAWHQGVAYGSCLANASLQQPAKPVGCRRLIGGLANSRSDNQPDSSHHLFVRMPAPECT